MRCRYFAHGHVRTLIGVFGALFNKTFVAEYSADGLKIDKLMHVPIIHVPRSRIYKYEESDWKPYFNKGDLERFKKYYSVYPRMGFAFKGMSYDQNRQLPKTLGHRVGTQYGKTPAPYTLNFELTVISKDQTKLLQIIEQICPQFKPNVALEVQHTAFDGATIDVNVHLESVTTEDSFDNFENSRFVTATMTFTMTTDYWPNVVGADLEITKFVNEGGVVEFPIGQIGPCDTADEIGPIEKIIIHTHEYSVFPGLHPSLDKTVAFYNDTGDFVVEVTVDPPAETP